MRGSGRFNQGTRRLPIVGGVSIPFIAGQWSLPAAGGFHRRIYDGVSIPFIAGQWSLPDSGRQDVEEVAGFQSPSLRGSGRFPGRRPGRPNDWLEFQSPSLRGSGRFLTAPSRRTAGGQVSIPFIAGQWSLRKTWKIIVASSYLVSIPFIAGQWSLRAVGAGGGVDRRARFNPLHCGAVVASKPFCAHFPGNLSLFQSPSLRGSGRFLLFELRYFVYPRMFQSPSLRGSGRFKNRAGLDTESARSVSIPFIAGQWSLRHTGPTQRSSRPGVSIPFIAGQWSLPHHSHSRCRHSPRLFQSPSLRGSGRFYW